MDDDPYDETTDTFQEDNSWHIYKDSPGGQRTHYFCDDRIEVMDWVQEMLYQFPPIREIRIVPPKKSQDKTSLNSEPKKKPKKKTKRKPK